MYQVLLVDDEINILEGIAALVDWSACGAQLRNKATNGLMAYELIKSEPPDIVITDIKMPGMNGVELIKKKSMSSTLPLNLLFCQAMMSLISPSQRWPIMLNIIC